MASVKKVLLKNTTRMSLHERFTFIRENEKRSSTAVRVMDQLASSKNRRLALQLEHRATLPPAQRRKEVPRAANLRERLSLPRGFSARRRGARAGYVNSTWKSPLLRNQRRPRSGGADQMDESSDNVRTYRPRLGRSRSPFPSRRKARSRSRARSGSRARSRSRARSTSRPRGNEMRSKSPFRSRSIRRFRGGRSRGMFRGRGRGGFYRPDTFNRGGFRGRSSFRRRARGRPFRRDSFAYGQKNSHVTKEDLDMELDQYMSTSKASLDKEMDTYMSEEKWD